jgi:tripartite-type tricarboxylate transporter receptor subunit TctC
VTGGQRSATLPDLPTIAEAGVPGYEMLNWLGMFAPAGTPRPIVERLSTEVVRIMRTAEARERLNSQGAEPSPLPAEEFAPFVKREVEKWAKVVAATGMTVRLTSWYRSAILARFRAKSTMWLRVPSPTHEDGKLHSSLFIA